MYLVNKYALGTSQGDGYMLYDINTEETKWVTSDELKELVEKKQVANVDSSLNISGRKSKVNASLNGEDVVVHIVTMSNNLIAKAKKLEQENNETPVIEPEHRIQPMDKFKFISQYVEHTRELLCNGTPLSLDTITITLNPNSQENELVNNGEYELSSDDKLIPVDMYMAFYSLENDKTPLWTNLICYNEKNRNFIKISQILACADLADGKIFNDKLHCDNGRSYVNDCTTSVTEMVYYGVDWINRNNEIYAHARENYGNEIVDTTLAKIPYESIRNFTHRVYGN